MCPDQVKVLHVVRALHVFDDSAAASSAERFNRILLTFLHLRLVSVRDNGDGFARVNHIRFNRVTVQVVAAFDWIDFAGDFNLVRLHHFLDLLPNVSEADVYSSSFDA